ncbi:MAG: hypothetical protein GWO26_01800 [Phycisphaerae bacterium]|nr:hypothetical protein [Phycisphaerae bacterium]
MKKRKHKRIGNQVRKQATEHHKLHKPAMKSTWKHTQLYNRTPPRTKSPSPEAYTRMDMQRYLELCQANQ